MARARGADCERNKQNLTLWMMAGLYIGNRRENASDTPEAEFAEGRYTDKTDQGP